MLFSLDGKGPLYQQIYRAMRAEILARRLSAGARLPATRVLAAELGLSRNVVLLAYDLLVGEGYAHARRGSGTVVALDLPAGDGNARPVAPSLASPVAGRPFTSAAAKPQLARAGERIVEIARNTPPRWEAHAKNLAVDFRFGRPAFGDFPHDVWCRLLGRRARRASRRDLDYGPPQGRLELREAIAERLRRQRGVEADPRNVVVVNGSQQALDLVVRLLVDPGDPVLIEEPHYIGARWVLAAAGARLVAAPVDDDGMKVQDIDEAPPPRLAYVTPSHQFPTGVVLSLGRRLELIDWAARTNAYVIEDDYDGEYRYGGRPLQALAGLDPHGRVVYVGTFSKLMFPALRLGYLVLPDSLVEAAVAAKAFADTGSSSLEQLALADFLREGHFERHLARTRARNAARRDALLRAIGEHFGDRAEVVGAAAGLHVLAWVRGRDGAPIRSAARLAENAGVGVYSVTPYYLRPPRRSGILLGYAPLSESRIHEGIERLARALG